MMCSVSAVSCENWTTLFQVDKNENMKNLMSFLKRQIDFMNAEDYAIGDIYIYYLITNNAGKEILENIPKASVDNPTTIRIMHKNEMRAPKMVIWILDTIRNVSQ